MATYPTSVVSYTSKVDDQVIEPEHVNDIQTEVEAVEDALLNGFAHNLLPSTSNARDLGSTSLFWRTMHLQTSMILKQTTANYTLTWANPAAARAISIPDPLGTDVFVFRDMTQTLAGKTLTTPTIASFVNAGHNHQAAAGGGQLDAALALTGILAVANGGTGLASLTANRIPYGNGTSAFQSAAGFTFDGTTFTIPGQIAFPAAQAASTGANTLDDYEEGTWTPVIGGAGGTSGQAYSNQEGYYVKIGQLVIASCHVALSTKGTITGDVQIQGLPFTSITTTDTIHVAAVNWHNLATTWVNIMTIVNSNATTAGVWGAAAAAGTARSTLATADINNNTVFRVTIIYRASA